jgi:TonB family protein
MKLAAPIMLFLIAGLLLAQTPTADRQGTPSHSCRLVASNPPKFDPFQFVPQKLDFTRLNRFPKVAYIVSEDGSVSSVKILKGTSSAKVDAALVKSIQAWKYKPQPGCTFEMTMGVIIDIGSN